MIYYLLSLTYKCYWFIQVEIADNNYLFIVLIVIAV